MSSDYENLINCGCGPIVDMAMKCESVFASHNKALVSISGGADSDVMLDLCESVRRFQPIEIEYVWFNTGLEYHATKEHLTYLEQRYGIRIMRERPHKTVPIATREYGQPFLSKQVSQNCMRLQLHGFKWEDEPFEVLFERYPKCKSALRWWCNTKSNDLKSGRFNIARNRWLKEFMVENPPEFKISPRCCDYAKKNLAHRVEREVGADVSIVGVRKAEGGARAGINSCFKRGRDIDVYRPLFWLSNKDKETYDKLFDIRHSDCYEIWGMKRTGCVGCPFGRDVFGEVGLIERYEPKLAKACRMVFADSYEYTRRYREFTRLMAGRTQ